MGCFFLGGGVTLDVESDSGDGADVDELFGRGEQPVVLADVQAGVFGLDALQRQGPVGGHGAALQRLALNDDTVSTTTDDSTSKVGVASKSHQPRKDRQSNGNRRPPSNDKAIHYEVAEDRTSPTCAIQLSDESSGRAGGEPSDCGRHGNRAALPASA